MSEEAAPELAADPGFPCASCGARVAYVPGTKSLVCPFCNSAQEIPDAPSEWRPIEHAFDDMRARAAAQPAADLAEGARDASCESCGARVVSQATSSRCPYCGSPLVARVDCTQRIAPESLLPFALGQAEASERHARWVRSRWFAPSDFKRQSVVDVLAGVYVPYWTFDAATTTNYRGQRGEHYTVTRRVKGSDGKSRTVREQRTRWYPASGTVDVAFDDVLVAATQAMPREMLERLEPWKLDELRPFERAFLAGMQAERYAIDIDPAYGLAQDRMQPRIDEAIRRDIGGDTQRISAKQTHYRDISCKHLLLPVWLASYRYKDKVYRYMLNPQTGKDHGERPYSWRKITLFVLGCIGAILGTIVAIKAAQG